jgi:hypothetical protein
VHLFDISLPDLQLQSRDLDHGQGKALVQFMAYAGYGTVYQLHWNFGMRNFFNCEIKDLIFRRYVPVSGLLSYLRDSMALSQPMKHFFMD